jgi:MFS family permease
VVADPIDLASEDDGGPVTRLLRRIPATGALRSLRHPAYLTLWSAQLVMQLGFWVSNIAFQWQVARLTDNDPFMLGFLYFSNLGPVLLFAPYAGLLADRFERKRIVALSQLSAGLLALGLVVVMTAVGDGLSVVTIFVFAFLIGTALALNSPASSAVMVNTVPGADVASAVSMHAVGLNLSRVAGPALASPLLGAWGARPAFTVYAVTSIIGARVVSRLRLSRVERVESNGSLWRRMGDGWRIARSRPPAALALTTVAVCSIFSSSYVSQLAVFAYEVLDGTDATFAALVSLTGLGAATGALTTSMRKGLPSLRGIGVELLMMAVALVGFTTSRSLPVSLVLAVVIGCLNFSVMTNLQTTLQFLAPEWGRGRVMSLHMLAWAGLLPIGGLLLGSVASAIGTPVAVMCSVCFSGAFALGLIARGPRIAPEFMGDEG